MEQTGLNKQVKEDGTQAPPLCYAPFISLLIDTNRGVRPCCAWQGDYMGNLAEDKLPDILNSKAWKDIQNQMLQQEWPYGCTGCKQREAYTGRSVRLDFTEQAERLDIKESPLLVEVELNSSNRCNLTCIHCSSDFSSSWIELEQKLVEDKFALYQRTKFTPQQFEQNPEKTLADFSSIDTGHIRVLRFKGGEPFMNKEVKQLLLYLNTKGRLANIDIEFITNGTVIDKGYFELLQNARSVDFALSIDGIGDIQKYIRYGNSGVDRIEAFIGFFSSLPNVRFEPLVSVMPYNVFRLNGVVEWWQGINKLYPAVTDSFVSFNLMVIQPEYLNLNVLSDETRSRLIEQLKQIPGADFKHVIQALQAPYAGPHWRKRFVEYTRLMNKYRGFAIEDIVPELAAELVVPEGSSALNYPQFIEELNFLIANNCCTAEMYMKRAILKYESGDKAAAIEDFKIVYKLNPALIDVIPVHWFW
ncbi:MAG TPA: twitch domain-containing radical SAM protein [Chitinophagales bacterium]|nr:twitch domain-containing radical SAM protein [Chitinophagales bacterium]